MRRAEGFFRPKLRRRGASGAAAPAVGWESFYRRDPGGVIVWGAALQPGGADNPLLTTATPLYPAGVRQSIGGSAVPWSGNALASMQGGGLADALYAIAQPLPAGRIVRLVYGNTGNSPAVGSFIRMGVYANSDSSDSLNLYPAEPLYDSGDIVYTSLGPKTAGAIAGGGLQVEAGLYHFVITCNTTAAAGGSQGPALSESALYPVQGASVLWLNGEPLYNASAQIGWRHAQAYGALPASFPISAPRRLVISASPIASMPAIFYGFDPS